MILSSKTYDVAFKDSETGQPGALIVQVNQSKQLVVIGEYRYVMPIDIPKWVELGWKEGKHHIPLGLTKVTWPGPLSAIKYVAKDA